MGVPSSLDHAHILSSSKTKASEGRGHMVSTGVTITGGRDQSSVAFGSVGSCPNKTQVKISKPTQRMNAHHKIQIIK